MGPKAAGAGSTMLATLFNFMLIQLAQSKADLSWPIICVWWLCAALIGWLIFPYFVSRSLRYRSSGWALLMLRFTLACAWGGAIGLLVGVPMATGEAL